MWSLRPRQDTCLPNCPWPLPLILSLLLSDLPASKGKGLWMWSQVFQPPLLFPPELEEAIILVCNARALEN